MASEQSEQHNEPGPVKPEERADERLTEPGVPTEELDPQGGEVPGDPMGTDMPIAEGDAGLGPADDASAPAGEDSARIVELEAALADRTNDLQRLQAEYVNYKRRVDRDRDLARNAGIESVVLDLLPLLDDLRIARQHEEMTGGFKLLVDELEQVTGKYGIETYGEQGDPFDPQIHEAMMQVSQPGVEVATCVEVMQPGYRFRGRVLRAARVAVAVPE